MNGFSVVFFAVVGVTEFFSQPGRAEQFAIKVQRHKIENGLVISTLSVNGEDLGTCYEHPQKQIPSGKYRGVLRYKSMKSFVQRPGGFLGKDGDFLLEVADVPERTDILFHAGSRPQHTEGCILCGPATKDPISGDLIAPGPLKKMRLLFYGTDMPNNTPNKSITIEVVDSS